MAGARRSSTAKVPHHLTVDQRVARGKAARAEVPRSSHAAFTPSDDRPDPVDLLEEQAGDVGGPPGTRTPNLRIKSPLLCQIELEARRSLASGARREELVLRRRGRPRRFATRST